MPPPLPGSVPELGAGACQAWWARPRPLSRAHEALLDPVEHDRYHGYRRPPDRNRFGTGAVLVRLLLGAHLGVPPGDVEIDRSCPRCGASHGRPRIPGSELSVSVSHSGERVLIACGRLVAVGADVEQVVPAATAAELAAHVLTTAEAATTPTGIEFTRYWTRKEAVLKAAGDGLAVAMTELTVAPPQLPPALARFAGRPDLPARTRMVALCPGAGYEAVLAIVDGSPTGQVTEHDAAPLLAAGSAEPGSAAGASLLASPD
jgi:4'-phosphopantetheinyl transferase